VIAREVFGSQDALIKIDMSEFSEKHTASRLVGAPAGYVGYEDGGKLTDKIRKQPYSVVLFDELEKAHSDIYNMLLQIIEDGKLTDAKGRSVDFSNTILILTSNLGADALRGGLQFGFSGSHDSAAQHNEHIAKARKELDRYLRPELLNRFDEIVTFGQLTRQDASKIFDRMATDLRNRLARKHITVRITPSAKKMLLEKGFTSKDGVRPLARVIENEIEHRIAELLLSDEVSAGSIIVFTAKGGQVVAHCEHEGQKVVA
jgi:ATP-dependent Clp protease ATP-binding subunit ClpC